MSNKNRQTANCPMCGQSIEVLTGKKTSGNLKSHKNIEGESCPFKKSSDLPDDWFEL